MADGDTRVEGADLEGIEVDQPAQRRVGRVDDLKAAVAQEAVHEVGAHAAAHLVGGLHDDDRQSGALQGAGAGQTRQPGTHDQRVGVAVPHRAVLAVMHQRWHADQ